MMGEVVGVKSSVTEWVDRFGPEKTVVETTFDSGRENPDGSPKMIPMKIMVSNARRATSSERIFRQAAYVIQVVSTGYDSKDGDIEYSDEPVFWKVYVGNTTFQVSDGQISRIVGESLNSQTGNLAFSGSFFNESPKGILEPVVVGLDATDSSRRGALPLTLEASNFDDAIGAFAK